MHVALLRQRAARLLRSHRRWGFPASQPPDREPTLPSYAPHLFKLAYIAVGDVDSAAIITADVLAHAPADEGTALRGLVARLPQGWLSWPGAAGPGEWLSLHLRREQADRLLSVLGERDPVERIALALYLLWGVCRDNLDDWLGTSNMAEQVSEFISYVGDGLDFVSPPGNLPSCAEVAADLLDADDPQVGRTIRMHTLGCEACRRRIGGLRRTSELLRQALNVFFRTPPPANLAQLVGLRKRQLQELPITRWHVALVVVVLIALYSGLAARRDAPETAQAPQPQSAAHLIDQALHRFEAQPTPTGVLHEQIQIDNNNDPRLIERWYDYKAPHRLRITVRRPDQTKPLFDLSTDGATRIAYEFEVSFGAGENALIRDPQVQQVLPLLRQLPFVGSFGNAAVSQNDLDLSMLAEARRSKSVLLGATAWQGRPAYMVSTVTANRSRMILTIDSETFSLLEARVAPDVEGATTIQQIWRAQVVEVLPRAQVPASTFELGARKTVLPLVDPRQFTLQPMSNVDLNSAVAQTVLPMPQRLPDPALLAYLHTLNELGTPVLQVYEGEWSTLAIVVPRIPFPPAFSDQLDRQFDHGKYARLDYATPGTTTVEFTMDAAPSKRMMLYFWHGLASDAEREAMVVDLLNSMELVDARNASAYSDRFVPPAVATNTSSLPPSFWPASLAVSSGQQARRIYARTKAQQLVYQQERSYRGQSRLTR